MPAAPSVSKELRRDIAVRLALVLVVLTAATLAWYALEPNDRRPVHDDPAVRPEATGVSGPVKTETPAPTPQSVIVEVKPQLAAAPEVAAASSAPGEPAKAEAVSPLHSEGMMRTLGGARPESAASDEATAGPAIESQPATKRKLPAGAYLQVGVFMHPANAAELKAKLEAEGVPVVIATRVQVGPFKSRKEAEEMREKLKAKGMDALLINP